MAQLLCPILIGRTDELRTMESALEEARSGRGGVVFLSGEPGIGKSRLTREAEALAESAGMETLRGRAAQPDRPVPYRAVVEAIRSRLRQTQPPGGEDVEPFQPHLARLLPELGPAEPEPADSSPTVVLEGLLRLLSALAGSRGALVVLEDLHWSDADTLTAVEYFADNLAPDPLLLMATLRSEPPTPALRLAEDLAARRAAVHLRLDRLGGTQVEEMIRATLSREDVPQTVAEAITSRAEGVPFFVEEMLSSYVTSGKDLQALKALPATYRDLVRERLNDLGGQESRLLTAAAVLGRTFDWTLLPAITGLREEAALASLRGAVAANLIVPARIGEQTSFAFRHALAREAIQADLLPPELTDLSRRAADAIESAHPELFGEWCEVVAELREHAGEPAAAARQLTESGRRALARGALGTAETTLERARVLAEADPLQVGGIEQVLLETLVQAGKTERILEIGEGLLAKAGGPERVGRDAYWDPVQVTARVRTRWAASAHRLAELHLLVARGVAARPDGGRPHEHLDEAERLAELSQARPLLARVTSFRAGLALTEGRSDEAARLAGEAESMGSELGVPDVVCEALHVQGHFAATRGDADAARKAFREAQDVAEREGMPTWLLRSLLELGTLDRLEDTPEAATLERARELAHRTGAVASEARAGLQLALRSLDLHDLPSARAAVDRCLELCRRFGLPLFGQALVVEAMRRALDSDRTGMESVVAKVLAAVPEDGRIEALAWGAARATLALVEDRAAEALRALDRASGADPVWGFGGLAAFLAALDGSVEPLSEAPGAVGPDAGYRACAEAVTLGREGNPQKAAAALERGIGALPDGWRRHHARRLAAAAALDDRWGDPATWLQAAAEFFEAHGMLRLLASTRGLLRKAGVKVRRRGRGESEVPEQLRALGVTSREMDVLRLVGEGLSNRDIGERLFLSPRTVETHVSSLSRKAGVGSRAELVAFAAGSSRILGPQH